MVYTCFVLFLPLTKLFISMKFPIIFVLIFCLIGLMFCHKIDSEYISTPVFVFRIYPFFLIGYMTPWKRIIELRHSKKRFFGIPFMLLLMCVYGLGLVEYSPLVGTFIDSIFILFSSIICVYVCLMFFPGRKLKLVTSIGKAS